MADPNQQGSGNGTYLPVDPDEEAARKAAAAPTPLRFLTPADAAAHLNTTTAHLARLRSGGRGPVYFKIGSKLVRYELSVLNNWLKAQTRTQTIRADATGAIR